MRTIRNHVFETNSSSCHSVTIMSKDTWEKFKNYQVVLVGAPVYHEHETVTLLYGDDKVKNLEDIFHTLKNLSPDDDDYDESIIESIRNLSFDEFISKIKDPAYLEDILWYLIDIFDCFFYFDDSERGWDSGDIKEAKYNNTDVIVISREVCC